MHSLASPTLSRKASATIQAKNHGLSPSTSSGSHQKPSTPPIASPKSASGEAQKVLSTDGAQDQQPVLMLGDISAEMAQKVIRDFSLSREDLPSSVEASKTGGGRSCNNDPGLSASRQPSYPRSPSLNGSDTSTALPHESGRQDPIDMSKAPYGSGKDCQGEDTWTKGDVTGKVVGPSRRSTVASENSSQPESDLGLEESSSTDYEVEAVTPKIGGFGVRQNLVPHEDGMKSAATDRAKRSELESSERAVAASGTASIDSEDEALHSSKSTEWGANFWCVITDPKSQNSFFANPQTGECKWEVPAGTIVLPPNPDGEWWELRDEQRGIPYYYHTQSASSQWNRPKGFVIPLVAIQATTLGKRFSFTEFGEENLAALAAIGQDSTKADQGVAPAPGSPRRRSSQPPPPAQSPSIDQVLALQKRREAGSGTDRDLVAQALKTKPLSRSLDGRHNKSYIRGLSEQLQSSQSVSFAEGALKNKKSQRSLAPPPSAPSSRSLNGISTLTTIPSSRSSLSSGTGHMTRSSSEGMKVIGDPGFIDSSSGSSFDISLPIRRERDPERRMNVFQLHQKGRRQRPIPVSTKRLSTGEHRCLPSALQSDIRRFAFEGFALRKFTTHRVGPFRRKLPLSKMMHWQKGPINAPLLNLDGTPELQKDAIKIFKVIQRVFGDRDAPVHSRPPLGMQNGADIPPLSPRSPSTNAFVQISSPVLAHGGSFLGRVSGSPASPSTTTEDRSPPSVLEEERWLLEKGLASPPLRDEIYAQTLKQLSNNPSGASLFRGWQFLSVLLVTFPPSRELSAYVSTFIQDRRQDEDGSISTMADHCNEKLAMIRNRGPRGKPPSLAEIQSASDAAFNPCVFGRTLEKVMETQREAYPDAKEPIVLVFLCNALLALDALKTEGIFRIAGDFDSVTELRVRIERGHYSLAGLVSGAGRDADDGSKGDVSVVASVFKIWLRELEQPLIPLGMYNQCVAAAEQSPSRCIEMVARLPKINRRVVLFVISFLQLFTQPSVVKETKMGTESLSLVFAPNFFRCESNSLSVVFNNSRFEQKFVSNLINHLPCSTLDEEYSPVHGEGLHGLNLGTSKGLDDRETPSGLGVETLFTSEDETEEGISASHQMERLFDRRSMLRNRNGTGGSQLGSNGHHHHHHQVGGRVQKQGKEKVPSVLSGINTSPTYSTSSASPPRHMLNSKARRALLERLNYASNKRSGGSRSDAEVLGNREDDVFLASNVEEEEEVREKPISPSSNKVIQGVSVP
ncbi:hypothetical protein IE53DRAFT_368281 [Violaceomyces palustris]|uniref:Uncharacterized protein n=1 Tax=Violaceomyces palustris TaxID=1673888 RepID=A0ACD0NZE8_9BASI|nr:hypothetical protein IE53DRAFT_368281 [Violaceomyces palustris]